MSYAEIQPAFYEMNFPQGPWHAGAPGWTRAPWVTWGDNPAQAGPRRLAVQGLGVLGDGGVDVAASQDAAAPTVPAAVPVVTPKRALLVIGGVTVAGALAWYLVGRKMHPNKRGYRRNARRSRAYAANRGRRRRR